MTDLAEEQRYCFECGTDWRGAEIEPESRHLFGGASHFSRLIAIEDRDRYDGVSAWKCPDCGAVWDSWTQRLKAAGKVT